MLQILVKNNIRILGAATPLVAAVTKALTVDNPAYKKLRSMGKRAWGVPPKIEIYVQDRDELVVPRGFIKQLEVILKTQGHDVAKVVTYQTQQGKEVPFTWASGWDLRSYQQPFVDSLLEENGVGVAPAGSGKTIMALRYIAEKQRAALWITHTTDLMHQTADKARKVLTDVGDIGFFGDGLHSWGDGKLIIATVQTLQRNPHLISSLNEFVGTVVIDEAHHFPAVQFVETVALLDAENVIGVTATPDRKDGLDVYMTSGIGPVLTAVGRDDLYASGELIKPELKFIYTDYSYDSASDVSAVGAVEAGGDDVSYTDIARHLIYDEARAKLVAQTIVDAAPDGPAIVITESVRYCFVLQKLVKELLAAKQLDLKTAVVHGGISRYKWQTTPSPTAVEVKEDKNGKKQYKVEAYTEKEFAEWQVSAKERRSVMEACDRKEVAILFATQLAREGLDMPHLVTGHMAMPKNGDKGGKASGGSVEQEIGRIQRKDPANPDKKATWYDYVDYNNGIFKQQYNSRRKVYKRLGLTVPNKPRTEQDDILKFLGGSEIFDLPY